MDNIELMIKIKSNRGSSYCSSHRYPFLKMEGWWLMVLDKNLVVHLEQFSFNLDGKYETKFYRGLYREHGNYGLTVKVLSDCYYGLDVEQNVKFTVSNPKKVPENVVSEEKVD
jgi:hypothetical protein